jgi:hypothetical protein
MWKTPTTHRVTVSQGNLFPLLLIKKGKIMDKVAVTVAAWFQC